MRLHPQEVATKVAPKKPVENSWEIKDRIYYLKNGKTPLTLTIPGKHTRKHALLYFDEKLGSQREIRYATNQDSPLVDEQKGEATMGHIRFDEGTLLVPKSKTKLTKIIIFVSPFKRKIIRRV